MPSAMSVVRIMCLLLLSLLCSGDNSVLVEKKVQELKELNEEILRKLGNLDKYKNKDIYVKARILPGGKKIEIEKISLDKKDIKAGDSSDKVLILKGKVGKVSDDSKFKLDLKYVLPPEKDESGKDGCKTEKKEVEK